MQKVGDVVINLGQILATPEGSLQVSALLHPMLPVDQGSRGRDWVLSKDSEGWKVAGDTGGGFGDIG
ncbi:MAG: hypothetical protein ACR2FO_04285 [Actinomycetota bacterium]